MASPKPLFGTLHPISRNEATVASLQTGLGLASKLAGKVPARSPAGFETSSVGFRRVDREGDGWILGTHAEHAIEPPSHAVRHSPDDPREKI